MSAGRGGTCRWVRAMRRQCSPRPVRPPGAALRDGPVRLRPVGSCRSAPLGRVRSSESRAATSLPRASSMAMTAPFIPPCPISDMMTTSPRVSGGSRSLAAFSAVDRVAHRVGDLALGLRDRRVELPERLVVRLVPRQPLVEDGDVDRVRQLVAQRAGVGDLLRRPAQAGERVGVLPLAPELGGRADEAVVLGEQPAHLRGGDRAPSSAASTRR